MEMFQLQMKYIEYNASLFTEGYVDCQFGQLQQLQASGNPGFVGEVVSMFFTDSDKILNDLTVALYQQPIDFRKLTEYTHQFKGSTSSIGAQRLRDGCDAFHNFSCEQNAEGCMRSLQQVKQEYLIVKEKLQNLITLERQIEQAGGKVPLLQ